MRVLFTNWHYSMMGGAQTWVYTAAQALAALGHVPLVWSDGLGFSQTNRPRSHAVRPDCRISNPGMSSGQPPAGGPRAGTDPALPDRACHAESRPGGSGARSRRVLRVSEEVADFLRHQGSRAPASSDSPSTPKLSPARAAAPVPRACCTSGTTNAGSR